MEKAKLYVPECKRGVKQKDRTTGLDDWNLDLSWGITGVYTLYVLFTLLVHMGGGLSGITQSAAEEGAMMGSDKVLYIFLSLSFFFLCFLSSLFSPFMFPR